MPHEEIKNSKEPPKLRKRRLPKKNVPQLRKRKRQDDQYSEIAIKGPLHSDSSDTDDELFGPKPLPVPMRINYEGEYGLSEPEDPFLDVDNDEPLLDEPEQDDQAPIVNQPDQPHDEDQIVDDDTLQDDINDADMSHDEHNATVVPGPRASDLNDDRKVSFNNTYYQRTFNGQTGQPGLLERAWNRVVGNKTPEPLSYAEKAKLASKVPARPILSSTPKEGDLSKNNSPGFSPINEPMKKGSQNANSNSTPKSSRSKFTPTPSQHLSPGSPSNNNPGIQESLNRTRLFPKSPDSTKVQPWTERQLHRPQHNSKLHDSAVKEDNEDVHDDSDHGQWTTVIRNTRSSGKVKDQPNVMPHPIEYKRRKQKKK